MRTSAATCSNITTDKVSDKIFYTMYVRVWSTTPPSFGTAGYTH